LNYLVLLFTSFLAIPLACQCCFDTTLFTGLEVVGVTLYFLDDVFLLNLTLEAAQGVLQRLALLQPDFCQYQSPPLPSNWTQLDYLTVAKKCGKE